MDAYFVGAGSARESGAAIYQTLRGVFFAGRARSHKMISHRVNVNEAS